MGERGACMLICLFFIQLHIIAPILTKFGRIVEDLPGEVSDIINHAWLQAQANLFPNCFFLKKRHLQLLLDIMGWGGRQSISVSLLHSLGISVSYVWSFPNMIVHFSDKCIGLGPCQLISSLLPPSEKQWDPDNNRVVTMGPIPFS
jgi:hypothetical protein